MRRADGGAASLPIVGGARPIRLVAPNPYNVLVCNHVVLAGMVIGHINQSHPKLANCFYAFTQTATRKF
jgi:hypothetical protein